MTNHTSDAYQLTLYRHATVLARMSFHRLATAKQVARDNLHEYAATMAIIDMPRGGKMSKTSTGSRWHRIDYIQE